MIMHVPAARVYTALAHPAVADQVINGGCTGHCGRDDMFFYGLVRLLLREAQRRGFAQLTVAPKGGRPLPWGRWTLVDGRWCHAGQPEAFASGGLAFNRLVWGRQRSGAGLREIGRRRRELRVWAAAVAFDEADPVALLVNEDAADRWTAPDVAYALVSPGGRLRYGGEKADLLVDIGRREAVAGAVEVVHREYVDSVATSSHHNAATLKRFDAAKVEDLARDLAAAAGLDLTALLTLAELSWEYVASQLVAESNAALPSLPPLPDFFPAPTAVFPVIATMSGAAPKRLGEQLDLSGPQPRRVRRWRYANEVVVAVPLEDVADGRWHETLSRVLDPLTLKILYGCLFFCARRGQPEFYYRPEKMLDLLGYQRDRRGRHYSGNRQRVDERLQALASLVFEFAFRREPYTVTVREPLISIDREATVRVEVGRRTVAHGTRVRMSKLLWRDVADGKFFTWIDPRFLQIDPRCHAEALVLYPYYASSWRMDWRRSRGRLRRRLRSILQTCGVVDELGRPSGRLQRKILRLEQEHEFLATAGLIGGWDIVEFCPSDRLEELWEIQAPEGWCRQVGKLGEQAAEDGADEE